MKRLCKVCGIVLICCLLCFINILSTKSISYAGISNLSVFENENLIGTNSLSGSLWYFEKVDNSGTVVENDEIVFSPKNYIDSRFNLKRKINDLSYCDFDLNFELNGKFLFTELPKGVRFVFAFGMAKVNTYPASGSTVLYFENKDGAIGFGIDDYTNNDIIVRKAFTEIPSYNSGEYVSVNLKVNSDGTGNGLVNGISFSVSELPTSGFAGFGQITENQIFVSVKLKDLSVLAYENSTPENTNVFEDFNQNCFNENVFQTKSRASGLSNSKLCVEDKVLLFSNTGSAYMETKYKYSNVDVAFDVVDVKKEMLYAPDGTILEARSCAFGLAFGIDVTGSGMQTKSPLTISFIPDRGVKTNSCLVINKGLDRIDSIVLPEKYNLFKVDDVFGVKIRILDGNLSIMMKTSEENGYTVITKEELGFTPLGYFQIAALGAFDSNLQKGLAAEQLLVGSFSIDNLAINNNDIGKLLKLVDYLSNNTSLPTDYVYENEWSSKDILESTIK